ncbi:restriction endonuclease subunit S [Lonepinella koalarum]|uniref:restriction endonuclease subunit S n=1 Tax=Lonepinella koalarum TaxID=53417 RepID=UPI003F6DC8D2
MRLGELCVFNTSKSIDGTDIPLNSWVLDLEDIEKETGTLLQQKLKLGNNIKSQKNRFNKNDVLYGKLRPYLNKVIIANDNGFCSTEIVPLTFTKSYYNRFAQIVLMSSYFLTYAKINSHGTKMPRFNLEKSKEILFPLPPLNEQHRIVAKIEELLPFIDQYDQKEQTLTALNKNFPEQLKKSILQAAIQGKLTEQLDTDEPAIELVKRIQAEKLRLISEKKLKKPKGQVMSFAPDNLQNENMPFEIPENWVWVRFDELVHFYLGKTPQREIKEYWLNGKYHWVSISDIQHKTFLSNTKEKISEIALNIMPNITPKGTLIMSFKLSIGKVAILDVDGFHNEAIISIMPFINGNNITRDFLFHTLEIITEFVDKTGAIKGNTLNSEKLSKMLIPLPPLSEQYRIVEKIELLLKQIKYL